MNKLNKREQYLIIAAAVIIFVAGYAIFRLQPVHNELAQLQQKINKAQRKLNKEKSTERQMGSIKSLQKDVDELKQKMDTEKQTMAGYRQAFLDLQQNEKQADLKAAITRLIENQGITILEAAEASHKLDKIISVEGSKHKVSGAVIERPLIDFKLEGDFSQINAFITHIRELPYSVVITKLNLTVERQEDMRRPYQLLTELTLAL